MTHTRYYCERLADEHETPVIRQLARQLMDLHDMIHTHLCHQGIDDDQGSDALGQPLLVANREFNSVCPECACVEASQDTQCGTCCDTIFAMAEDRSIGYDD